MRQGQSSPVLAHRSLARLTRAREVWSSTGARREPGRALVDAVGQVDLDRVTPNDVTCWFSISKQVNITFTTLLQVLLSDDLKGLFATKMIL